MTETFSVSFVVPGEPVGKGRARVGRVNGHARMFTPAKTAAYEGLVALAAKTAIGPGSPLEGPVAVEIEAVHTVPASWSNKRRQAAISGAIIPTCKPDLSNILKAIEDGGNGVAWRDDSQIAAIQASRRYGLSPEVRVRAVCIAHVK